jgi:hypothetical protein
MPLHLLPNNLQRVLINAPLYQPRYGQALFTSDMMTRPQQ